ncbi:Aste57867_10070 [Aphanomyces stellatus]|uniref:glutathione gamma-glutamylcysteinyltransferase n=1 Tax=Aphanomyces stellatus TaxID=120398 RepID=A0A485KPG3_9STRA|nr:hypothetical protein As57867_010031 [Aphanomyces stellatus]VFT86946.1 Aste57867_10070 [Aphanomyces stellatus]
MPSLAYTEPKHHGGASSSKVLFCLLFVPSILAGLVFFLLSIVLGYPFLLVLYLFKREVLTSALTPASQESIRRNPAFRDAALLARVWQSPVGQLYLHGPLEYQLREGYCAPTTLRNVLHSIPSLPAETVPAARSGPSTAVQYKTKIDAIGATSSTVVYGSDGFSAFVEAIKLANDPQYRVAVNFLHAALFGMGGPKWFAPVLLGAVMGGHFSNVIGYLEDVDMVLVFDVNQDFGPYLVDTHRLFQAVRASDIQSGKSRALVVSQLTGPATQV